MELIQLLDDVLQVVDKGHQGHAYDSVCPHLCHYQYYKYCYKERREELADIDQ